MADLGLSIPYVFQNEGGFAEPPEVDQPTNLGIIAADIATFRNAPLDSITIDDIKSLTKLEATEIYRMLYWDKILGDQIKDQNIATCIFDTAVNRGPAVSVKYAQRALVFSGAKLFFDGIMGQTTIYNLNQCYRPAFISRFEGMEFAGYEAILASNPGKYERYRAGWEDRAKRLLTLI